MSLEQITGLEIRAEGVAGWLEMVGSSEAPGASFFQSLDAIEAANETGLDAREFRDQLYDGRLFLLGAFATTRYSYVVVSRRLGELRKPLSLRERIIFSRVLSGEQQKFIAADLNLACSTVATYYMKGLRALGMNGRLRTVPLPVIVCAHVGPSSDFCAATKPAHHLGAFYAMVPRPRTAAIDELTPAEQDVARLILDGTSKRRIAGARSTSIHTVTNQIHAIFSKLKITGRFSLIRLALERGCFG
jgi:DNA-binding NarL/FixJ family response regulator